MSVFEAVFEKQPQVIEMRARHAAERAPILEARDRSTARWDAHWAAVDVHGVLKAQAWEDGTPAPSEPTPPDDPDGDWPDRLRHFDIACRDEERRLRRELAPTLVVALAEKIAEYDEAKRPKAKEWEADLRVRQQMVSERDGLMAAMDQRPVSERLSPGGYVDRLLREGVQEQPEVSTGEVQKVVNDGKPMRTVGTSLRTNLPEPVNPYDEGPLRGPGRRL